MKMPKASIGFTLVELAVALTLNAMLLLGIAGAYVTIKTTMSNIEALENAQEVLRSTRELLHSSAKQATSATISAGVLEFTHDNESNNTKDCLGASQNNAFIERYRLNITSLECRVENANGIGNWSVINTGINALDFTLNGHLLQVRISPQGLPSNYPTAEIGGPPSKPYQRLDFALKTAILIGAN